MHLIANGGFEVDENSARNVLASAGLREEGVEGIVATSDRLVRGHLPVRLDSVLQAIQFPARIAGLNARLADVDGNNLENK